MKIQEALQTIANEVSGLYTEKGSKFLAFALPATDEQTAKSRRDALKKEHFKAVHVVMAYRIGENAEMEFSTDDGEQSGSAGRPVLNELKSRQLTNVAVLIVRYYGGKKLGVSGLINAYKSAAISALDTASLQLLEIKIHFRITCPAAEQHVVIKWMADAKANLEHATYGDTCTFLVTVNKHDSEAISLLKKNWHIQVETHT